jgi:uncharacterized protein YbaR (Trm112 family)
MLVSKQRKIMDLFTKKEKKRERKQTYIFGKGIPTMTLCLVKETDEYQNYLLYYIRTGIPIMLHASRGKCLILNFLEHTL